MKLFTMLCACLLALAVGVSPALAEHQPDSGVTAPKDGPAPAEPGGPQPSMPGKGPMGHGMMGAGTMGQRMASMQCPMQCPMMGCCGMARPSASPMSMMHQMMHQSTGGETDPASIGLTEAMGAGNVGTKAMGRMLQMRGEILKAIGEIMLKYGRGMEEEK